MGLFKMRSSEAIKTLQGVAAWGGGIMGSGVRVLPEEEAMAWAERWLMPSEYLAAWEAEEA